MSKKTRMEQDNNDTTQEKILKLAKEYGHSNLFATLKSEVLQLEIVRIIGESPRKNQSLLYTMVGFIQNYYAVELAKKEIELTTIKSKND